LSKELNFSFSSKLKKKSKKRVKKLFLFSKIFLFFSITSVSLSLFSSSIVKKKSLIKSISQLKSNNFFG
jgi:hypothetical protein